MFVALGLTAVYAVCFVAIKAGLAFAPPLLFAGLRAEIAGVALLGLVVFLRRPAAPALARLPVASLDRCWRSPPRRASRSAT